MFQDVQVIPKENYKTVLCTRNKNKKIVHQREHEHMRMFQTHQHNTSLLANGSSATEI